MENFESARQRLLVAQRTFIVCALCAFIALGIQSTFTIPPFQVPDESRHWVAAITRTNAAAAALQEVKKTPTCSVEFGLISKMAQDSLAFQPSNRMPSNTFASIQDTSRDCQESVISYGNMLTYPGVLIGKLLVKAENRRPLAALTEFYASRIIHGLLIFALLFRLLTLSQRARFVPFGLSLIAGLTLSPLFIQQSFGVSADPICLMFALSLASIVLFPSVINRFDVVAVLVLAVVACHTKPPMALFGFSAALLGLLRYSAKRYQTTLALLTIASALGATLVSISFNSGGGSTPDGQSVVSVSQQLAFALRNPVATFQSLDSALWSALSIEQLAHPLGWLDTHLHKRALSSWYTILWIALAFEVLGLLNLPWRSLSSRATGRSLGVSLLYLLGIYVASLATPFILYLSWTAVGAPGVEGMQSRYLFTSLLLVPAALTPFYGYEQPKTDAPEKVSHRIELGAVVVAMALLTALYVSELHITTAARYW